MRQAGRLTDMEVVFGSESVLSKEHLALAQASQTIETYGFADALIDQKALFRAPSRLLGRTGGRPLERVASGTLRFRLLRGRPSREKCTFWLALLPALLHEGGANRLRRFFFWSTGQRERAQGQISGRPVRFAPGFEHSCGKYRLIDGTASSYSSQPKAEIRSSRLPEWAGREPASRQTGDGT
jgi:hypothetical protein